MKNFKIKKGDILQLLPNMGSCIASDKIAIDGCQVGFMYREEPDFETDSGWRFFSGYETDEYINNPENLMIYDINTIANYDNAIIPYIEMEIGTELERQGDNSFIESTSD
ncbi:MAG TPA: DUF2185 domain-containing protein [Saprospiraceae bacterium]|nr:DUF2185 domain-containing protein [Saprospiraceae bacterium]HPN68178.1 DUF2185 domain-containing protein [Saprospiraceae bacterium]